MPKYKPEESALALLVKIERKAPNLPRFVVIPAASVEKWGIRETTVVEGILRSMEMGHRTLKRWDDQRWFIELPEPLCKKAGVDTGDSVTIILRLASNELPEELTRLLAEDDSAKAAWQKLTSAQQRMLREEITTAKQSATRLRRAQRALCSSSSTAQ